jgi:hypothetical protein
MKLRSADELFSHLDGEMAWRIKEVHQFKSAVENAKGKNIDTHIRAGVAMLYAHWEGFVKGAANAYVNYLSYRADLNRTLQPCFVALGMKSKLAHAETSSKSAVAVMAVTHLLVEMDQPVRLPRSDVISAESNLSSTVFINIVGWIGIDSSRYATRFPLIDKTLLDSRNNIAHGEFLTIDRIRFESLTTEVLEMLRWFKTDIENAVLNKSFLKKDV